MNPIHHLSGLQYIQTGTEFRLNKTSRNQNSFRDFLMHQFSEINDNRMKTKQMTAEFIRGGDIRIEDLLIQMQRSQVELNTLVSIRNKAIEAYQELMRMPV